MTLSVVIITHNEEANIARTLESVKWAYEIIVVDSGSTDRTVEIARSYDAEVYVEPWNGYAAQKNSAIAKATGRWILSLDADEEVEPELADDIKNALQIRDVIKAAAESNGLALADDMHADSLDRVESLMALEEALGEEFDKPPNGFLIPRKNYFLGRWIKHCGFWPDPKLRLFRRGTGKFVERAVHETMQVEGPTLHLKHALIHHSYPTLTDYLDHMNRYSSLGAEMAGARGFSVFNIVLRSLATFIYNYFFRLGFLDGREGMLLHLYHAVYVSWKYAKAWELGRNKTVPPAKLSS